ncbi:MAG: ribosomal subunit interface protein [Planctomycetaceae bacterium]|nr:ribosomal subunit interface protein [Planctomycetaceae bacterium]
MQVAITVRHGDVSDDTRNQIREKSEKLLTYFERVTAIDVMVDFENDHITVELLVDTEHKHNFVARSTGDEVMPVFDQTYHKMEQQIRKYKGKIQDHRRDVPMGELNADQLSSDD